MNTLPDELLNEVAEALRDPAARAGRLADLLERYPQHEELIRSRLPAADPPLPGFDAYSLQPGQCVAGYTILERLGLGGMGQVYVAQQHEPISRQVALKLVRADQDRDGLRQRLEFERQALALMSHRGIAQILDAGVTNEGRPWFAMELVRGQALTSYCDAHKTSIADRLQLFIKVCDAVQHAHNKGIAHRDLKPGNILVVAADGEVRPVIIDFGLARATSGPLSPRQPLTIGLGPLGTPLYMSPEQVAGSAEVDALSDIYSLGIVLRELLIGTTVPDPGPPAAAGFQRTDTGNPPSGQDRPSAWLNAHPDQLPLLESTRQVSGRLLLSWLRRDLDWVVLRATASERVKRYQSASVLAADVRLFLEQRPIDAAPPGLRYRLLKLLQRNRLSCAAGITVLLMAIGGFLAIMRQYRIADAARAEAQLARANTQSLLHVASAQLLAEQLLRHHSEGESELWPQLPRRTPAMATWLERAKSMLEEASAFVALLDPPDRTTDRESLPGAAAVASRLRDLMAMYARSLIVERIGARMRQATAVGQQSLVDAAAAWDACLARVRQSKTYRHLDLAPQVGLIPLGPDPVSGLEEFAHLGSGNPASRDPSTLSLVAEETFSLVFVLLPGGDVRVGAEKGSAVAPFVDPDVAELQSGTQVVSIEGPPVTVHLVPFFISKCECSQYQWMMLSDGKNPSHYYAGRSDAPGVGLANPVETVSWSTARQVLARHGLGLPTEAQWEYSARAGTTSPWWTGPNRTSLLSVEGGAINIADATARRHFPFVAADEWPAYDDGYVVHAPVVELPANPFGLHGVLGNVFEWCEDEWTPRTSLLKADDGLRLGERTTGERTLRGGSFHKSVLEARCTARKSRAEGAAYDDVGIRPVRLLD